MLRVGKTFAISLVLSQWNSQPKVHIAYILKVNIADVSIHEQRN